MVACVCACTDLLSPVDDVLSVCQPVDAGSAYNRVVSGGGVGHFHRAELKEGLPQRHPAEQHLPEAQAVDESVLTLMQRCSLSLVFQFCTTEPRNQGSPLLAESLRTRTEKI